MRLNKYIIIFVMFFLTITACTKKSKNNVHIPKYVFSEDSMKLLLIDFYLTEAIIAQIEYEGKNTQSYIAKYYNNFLKTHNADMSRIANSIGFYVAHPSLLKSVSDKALDSLIVLETITR